MQQAVLVINDQFKLPQKRQPDEAEYPYSLCILQVSQVHQVCSKNAALYAAKTEFIYPGLLYHCYCSCYAALFFIQIGADRVIPEIGKVQHQARRTSIKYEITLGGIGHGPDKNEIAGTAERDRAGNRISCQGIDADR